jgi:hypothetical protein
MQKELEVHVDCQVVDVRKLSIEAQTRKSPPVLRVRGDIDDETANVPSDWLGRQDEAVSNSQEVITLGRDEEGVALVERFFGKFCQRLR